MFLSFYKLFFNTFLMDSIILVLFWVLFIILWLGFILNKSYYSKLFKNISDNWLLLVFLSFISFFIWFFIILYSNIFITSKTYILLLIWIIAIIKSIMILLFPEYSIKMIKDYTINKKNISLYSILIMIIWFILILIWLM